MRTPSHILPLRRLAVVKNVDIEWTYSANKSSSSLLHP